MLEILINSDFLSISSQIEDLCTFDVNRIIFYTGLSFIQDCLDQFISRKVINNSYAEKAHNFCMLDVTD